LKIASDIETYEIRVVVLVVVVAVVAIVDMIVVHSLNPYWNAFDIDLIDVDYATAAVVVVAAADDDAFVEYQIPHRQMTEYEMSGK
jgi:hypothetical protein